MAFEHRREQFGFGEHAVPNVGREDRHIGALGRPPIKVPLRGIVPPRARQERRQAPLGFGATGDPWAFELRKRRQHRVP